jgi:hypothetical protein
MLSAAHIEQFRTKGYFIVDDAVEPAFLQPLLAASRRVVDKVRSGAVDRFTHWAKPGDPWAIRGLYAPEFGEPIFAEYLMSKPVMSYTESYLGKELSLGDVVLFTNPHNADFGFGWHRDFGQNETDGTEQVELEILNRPMTSLKWHLALVDDACLMCVPGSHRRYRTACERERMHHSRHADIPGQETIELKAGQTVVWNGNIIHRGVMKKDVERMTLSGIWQKYTEDDVPQQTDPRFKWLLAENVRGALPEAMRPLYDRWRSLQVESGRSLRPSAMSNWISRILSRSANRYACL